MRVPGAFAALVAGSIAVACSGEPLAPPSSRAPAFAASSQGMVKTPISGTLQSIGGTPFDDVLFTPSGRCHATGATQTFDVTGDLEGSLTAHYEPQNSPCNFVEPGAGPAASGPAEGTMTFHGTTGPVAGHWNTNCRPADTAVGVSCDGIMNLRGYDALEGVQFHIYWGPAGGPSYPYEGTAFSR